MNSFVSPFDAVELIGGAWCFAHADYWGVGPYRLDPKYVPANEYPHKFLGHFWSFDGKVFARLGSAQAKDQYVREHRSFFTQPDGAVPSGCVKQVVSARLDDNHFLDVSADKAARGSVRSAAFHLIQVLLGGGLSTAEVGITGSVLLDGEIDGFSDFDLVLYGADAIRNAHHILDSYVHAQGSKLRYRTYEEGLEFYKKYSVVSNISSENFAKSLVTKYSQGFMQGVPFSIFQVPSEEEAKRLASRDYKSEKKSGVLEKFNAQIVGDKYSRFTFQCLYRIQREDSDPVDLICYDRACTEQAKVGDWVDLKAYRMPNGSYCVFPNDGYVLRVINE